MPVIGRIGPFRFSVSGSVGRRYRWETTEALSGAPVWQEGEPKRLTENELERTFDATGERLFIRVRLLLP